MQHPRHALAIALRRQGLLSRSERARVLEHCASCTDVVMLRACLPTLPVGRLPVMDLLAPANLPRPEGWEPVALIGQDGMGEAWLCGRADGALAVMKTLLPELLADADARARFAREVALTCRLRHPHVVSALAADADAGWLLLEFMAGGDLRAAVQAGSALTEADALAVALQVADGLAAFERAGLAHRDLKPSNLFLTPDGVVKIADLGLACRAVADRTRLTGIGRVVGSAHYMAPELFVSDHTDRRCDYFALGATLVALLSGRFPGGAADGPLTLAEVERRVRLSPALHGLLARLLAHDPQHRPADAAALHAAITAAGAALGGIGTAPSVSLRATASRLEQLGAADDGTGDSSSHGPPLRGDRILFGCIHSPARLAVFAGSDLVLGKRRGDGVDVPLRNHPIELHRQALEEISRRHVAVGMDADGPWVRDLGSANGTLLDGIALPAQQRMPLAGAAAVLDCAGQVQFAVQPVSGGIVLRRLRNAPAFACALATGTLEIGGAVLPWPHLDAPLRLVADGEGWALDGVPLTCGPVPGMPATWVRPLEAADFDTAEPM